MLGRWLKTLGHFLYLEIADAVSTRECQGWRGFWFLLELLKSQTQVAGCKFITVGELAGILGSSKTTEPDSHELFKGPQSVLFLSAGMMGLKELSSFLSDKRHSH